MSTISHRLMQSVFPLEEREIWRGQPLDAVICLDGELWVTGEGSADIILTRGERWNCTGRGLIVVEALTRSVVAVERTGQPDPALIPARATVTSFAPALSASSA